MAKTATDTGGWSRGFSYDQLGNMAVTANNGVPAMNVNTPQSLSLFNANNQRTDQTYFPNGNLKSIQPGITLAYDAENRQTSAGGYSYSYDGAGHRVAKIGGGATTIYVYDAAGQLAEEYAPGSAWKKDYVRLGSQLIAEEYNGTVSASMPCTTCYFTYDHLGTVRLITDQNANVISRHDYLPFGEEIPANTAGRNSTWGPGNDSVTQKFTGKERDSESGLDYFGARYYGSALGRFTSPDEFKGGFENLNGTPAFSPGPIGYADLSDPQTLNMYVYTRNNPLKYIDPDGHAPSDVVYDGNTHTLTLIRSDGTVAGTWPAGNNVAIHAPRGEGSGYTNGPIQNGTYEVRAADQNGAQMHRGGTENSAYGPEGIVHVEGAQGATGNTLVGAGVHSGRADRGGPEALTAGCVRTTTDAVHTINQVAATDPVNTVTVRNNEANVSGWQSRAAQVRAQEEAARQQRRPTPNDATPR
jgi:RHS repeat-associated protein